VRGTGTPRSPVTLVGWRRGVAGAGPEGTGSVTRRSAALRPGLSLAAAAQLLSVQLELSHLIRFRD